MKVSAKDFKCSNENLYSDYQDEDDRIYHYWRMNLFYLSPGGVEVRLMFYIPAPQTQPHLQLFLDGRYFFDFVDTGEIDAQIDNPKVRPMVEQMLTAFIAQGRIARSEVEQSRLDQEAAARQKILDKL
jgi:hypothetical protein